MTFEKFKIDAETASEQEAKRTYSEVVKALTAQGRTVATAESCTGGLIGKLFTDVSGASAVFAGGMITYTNHIKINKLGVSAKTIANHTEVSFECASEMAERARLYFETDVGVSATGYAGPGGGTEQDPVGTVYVGVADGETVRAYRLSFGALTRDEIRYGVAKFIAEQLL